jgi:hypothetical protein
MCGLFTCFVVGGVGVASDPHKVSRMRVINRAYRAIAAEGPNGTRPYIFIIITS